MKIEKLDIKGFGKLENLLVRFSKDFNLVYGENEAGKTTVQWFIRGMLYSLKGGRSVRGDSVPPLKRYAPWHGNFYGGSIVYSLDSGASFTVERDFNENTVKVFDSSYNDISGTFKRSRGTGPLFASEHLGMNETCFERTVFIGQMDARIDAAGSRELVDKLSNIRETGSEEISLKRAKEALKDTLINYVGTDRSTTRPLDVVNSKLEELNKIKRNLVEEKEKAFEVEEKYKALSEVKRRYEERRGAVTCARKAIELRKNIEEMKKDKRELASIIKEIKSYEDERKLLNRKIEEYNRTKQEYESYSKYTDDDPGLINILFGRLEDAIKGRDSLHKKKTMLIEEIEGVGALNDDTKAASGNPRLIKVGIVASIILILLSGICAVIFPLKGAAIALTLVFAVLLLVFVYMGTGSKNMGNSIEKKTLYENTALQVTRLNDSMAELEKEMEENQQYINKIMTLMLDRLRVCGIIALEESEIRAEHIDAFRSGLTKYTQILENIARAREKQKDIDRYLQSLYGRTFSLYGKDPSREDLLETIDELDCKVNDLYEKIEEYCRRIQDAYSFADASLEYNELMEKITDAEFQKAEAYIEDVLSKINEKIEEATLEISRNQALVERVSLKEDEIHKIDTRMVELRNEKNRLLDIGFSLKTALDTLEEAALEIKREFVPDLNNKLGSITSLITKDKYTEVRAGDSLVLKALEPDTGRIVESPFLSGGTVEQLYLALRLALAQTIENGGEVLPLIMDEVFAHYDDKRVFGTLGMLSELSPKRQIILFTCKEREVQAAKEVFGNNLNIIELGSY